MPFRHIIVPLLLAAWVCPAVAQEASVPVEQSVREAAERAIAQRYPADAFRMEVRVERVRCGAAEGTPLRVLLHPAAGMPGGYEQVRLLAGSNQAGWQDAGNALLYVATYDSVVVATADVRRDDAVDAGTLSIAWMETTRFSGDPLVATDLRKMERAGRLFADRPLHEGRPLRAGDLRPPYAADTGDALTMTFSRGRVTLRLPVRAREPGLAGDEIRAYSTETGASYRVRLTGNGSAEWIETL